MKDRDVYFLWVDTPDHDDPRHLLSVDQNREDADTQCIGGLMATIGQHLLKLEPGGTVSVLCARGRAASEDAPNPAGTYASFVIDNPATAEHPAEKHDWTFRVEKRVAAVVPLAEGRRVG